MGTFWNPQTQQSQQQAQIPQAQDQPRYITEDDLDAYVRSNQFRAVMKNQNSDLYTTGKWRAFDNFELLQSNFPYTTFGTSNIGTDGRKSARYTQIGDTVIYTFTVAWASGFVAGTGAYAINVPVQPATPDIFNNVSSWFVDNKTQTFCGSVYVYGGDGIDNEGPIGWIHPSILIDPATGGAFSPGRIMFSFGDDDGGVSELFNDQLFFGPGGGYPYVTSAFPTVNSVMTGQIIYEASPSA